MSILAWIEDQKRLKLLNAPKYVNPASDSSKGLWTRCDKCGVILYIKHLKENQRVCFGCSYHLQMSSQERVENLLDKDSWRPLDETLSPCDPLEFHDQKDYTDRLQEAQERTGLQDAIQTGSGLVEGIPVALGVMDFDFMGGSMGSVVGEKVTRLIEYATQEGLTLILVCASGGARMQEGVFSLMQMAKISSALQIYQSCANLLYISILTSPTTGGVTASFAMLGDIIFAEPKALIAFAGRRVIEQTLCEDLPEDFQTSEYMLHHGLLDLIVPRRFLRQALSESIRLYKNAPFKKAGRIPFGVQNPITFLVEEKIRRQWALGNPSGNTPSIPDTLTLTRSKIVLGNSKKHAAALIANKAKNSSSNILPAASFAGLSTMLNERVGLNATSAKRNEKKNELYNSFDSLAAPQEGEVFTTLAPLQSVSENQKIERNTGEYRDILTSFQTMFDLFSKNIVQPYGIPLTLTTGDSPPFSEKSIGEAKNSHLDFFNKSIALAATESVEWRAFYVYQKISEKSGFFEDALYVPSTSKDENNVGADHESIEEDSRSLSALAKLHSASRFQSVQPSLDLATKSSPQNILFYRSICRSVN